MKAILEKSKSVIFGEQQSVFMGALVIMSMVFLSQVLGVVRQRILLSFFEPDDYSIFLAAFRLPDLIFEVLAYGAFSSAFIPVFSKLSKSDPKKAWQTAGSIVNLGILIFLPITIFFSLFTYQIYSLIAPGFSESETLEIARIAKILFAAQGVFVVSFVLTGVLESSRRFFVPAFAPVLYNVGIILTVLFFNSKIGLTAPALGVLVGALLHLSIQLPAGYILGFRFSKKVIIDEYIKKIGRLAAPRLLELSLLQLLKTGELFFASVVSTSAYAYLSLANSLQLVPITLFGLPLSKSAFPNLTKESDDYEAFSKTFLNTLYQMMFFIIPLCVVLIVLRIPVVRLIYGTGRFSWTDTVSTGLVLSAFAIGVPVQAALTLISRAFYALHNTKTPVILAIVDLFLTILLQVFAIFVFKLPIWSIALANSLSGILQVSVLYCLLSKKLKKNLSISPLLKTLVSSLISGGIMFVFLKTFDRAAWIKRLSFINSIDALKNLNFESFVLDTRYTVNLIVLVGVTVLLGAVVYLSFQALFGSNELRLIASTISKRTIRRVPQGGESLTISDQKETL